MNLYNWNAIPDQYKFVAMNKDRDIYAYKEEPCVDNKWNEWVSVDTEAKFLGGAEYCLNFPDWQDTLEQRPDWSD